MISISRYYPMYLPNEVPILVVEAADVANLKDLVLELKLGVNFLLLLRGCTLRNMMHC